MLLLVQCGGAIIEIQLSSYTRRRQMGQSVEVHILYGSMKDRSPEMLEMMYKEINEEGKRNPGSELTYSLMLGTIASLLEHKKSSRISARYFWLSVFLTVLVTILSVLLSTTDFQW